MLNWFFDTKLGHFLFILIFSIIIGGLVCVTFKSLSLMPMIIGASIVGAFFAITDKNDRWI